MFKKLLLSIALFIALLLTGNIATAQTSPGQLCLSGGLGFSVIFPFINISAANNMSTINTNNNNNVNTTEAYSTTPAYNAMLDYGFRGADEDDPVFSLGACIGYQSTTINYFNYEISGTNRLKNFQEQISRLNMGVRGLWHFTATDKQDSYLGLRVGYSEWTDFNNSGDLAYTSVWGNHNYLSIQALMGFRFYIIQDLGLHFEIAIGTPYLAEAGLTYKFGGTPENIKVPQHKEIQDVPIQVIH